MERATIVYNPKARNAPNPTRLRAAADKMQVLGWEIELLPTEGPGHATVLAKGAAEAGARVVIACGGDGTLNEVINGLAGSEATLAIIRAGTSNVFAKEVHIPRSIDQALRLLHTGEGRWFDLGVAGGRRFILMAGIGFDGRVVLGVPPAPKKFLGTTSYILWGMAALLRYRSRRVQASFEGEEQELDLYWLLLGNTRSYGGVIDVTYRAMADDGLLDAYLFTGRGLPWAITTGLRIVAKRQDDAPGVSFRRLGQLQVETPGLPVQADGEYFGETPMAFAVVPRAIRILLPRGGADRILSASNEA